MSAWIVEQHMDRSGAVTEQTVAVDLDPADVLALVGDISKLTTEPPRYVSLSVKFRQLSEGYVPDSARAYVTCGRPR